MTLSAADLSTLETLRKSEVAAKLAAAHRSIWESSGPVSDAFIVGHEPMMLLCGPIGSGKTIACCKKALVETTRIRPGPDGVRRYTLGVWREKYNLLWGTTIPSWKKVFDEEIFGPIKGSAGRPAEHVVEWDDRWGRCVMTVLFTAFGESADPEETRGRESTDVYLNEWDTLPEELTINLGGRVGREPPIEMIGREGRMFGDCNAPSVLNYTYRDFWENPPPGYRLYRQPGGLEPAAENPALGRRYYESIITKNAHRPWYVRRMVHNKPGFTRDTDIVYPAYDDDRHLSPTRLEPARSLRVIVGIDGGNTPAAVYMQETPLGQLRILDEIVTESAGMVELSRAMLRLEAERYDGCEFYDVCDPSMNAGEDTEEGSDQQRLSKLLKRKVHFARTQDPGRRVEPVKAFLRETLEDGRPALLLDEKCASLRRGFNQTYHYRRINGTHERSGIVKTPDSHPHDALGYGSLETSKGLAARLEAEQKKRRATRDQKQRESKRYSPFSRGRG